MPESSNRKMTPIRVNLLIIAGLIAIICFGLIYVLIQALNSSSGNDESSNSFIMGAVIGLIGGGITGLTSLETTLLNDK
ncbi:MAG: hypothetical protein OXH22_00385 [Chloroflexi bacterium]|nr:hypothetical protein [Chloroflexota bacterium]